MLKYAKICSNMLKSADPRSGVLDPLVGGGFLPHTPLRPGATPSRWVEKQRFPRVLRCFTHLNSAKTATGGLGCTLGTFWLH